MLSGEAIRRLISALQEIEKGRKMRFFGIYVRFSFTATITAKRYGKGLILLFSRGKAIRHGRLFLLT